MAAHQAEVLEVIHLRQQTMEVGIILNRKVQPPRQNGTMYIVKRVAPSAKIRESVRFAKVRDRGQIRTQALLTNALLAINRVDAPSVVAKEQLQPRS